MGFTIGNNDDIVNVLQEYLAEAKQGNFDAVAIAGYSQESHAKNVVITDKCNGVGLVGGIFQLLTEVDAASKLIEKQNEQSIAEAFNRLETDKDNAN